MTLRTGERDLHSGLYGGAAMNAAHALMRTLGAVVAVDGRLPEPLRKGILPPSEDELASWRELPAGADELADQGARPADAGAAEEFYLRTFAEPALDVNGIESGSPHIQKTVLPVEAVANVSIRLAPGQEVDEIAAALDALLRDAAPAAPSSTCSCSPRRRRRWSRPTPRRSSSAWTRSSGRSASGPLLIRSGGSLPIVAAFAEKQIATVITGFTLPNSNLHSPNERLLAEYVPRGIAAARALFEEFAAL